MATHQSRAAVAVWLSNFELGQSLAGFVFITTLLLISYRYWHFPVASGYQTWNKYLKLESKSASDPKLSRAENPALAQP